MKSTSVAPRISEQASSVVEGRADRILVVDTDDSARSILSLALHREGFETVTASSSIEAMRLLSPESVLPQLLVISSELREEDGFSFVAQLRGERRTSAIPVLLLATGKETNLQELSQIAGIDEVLLKPAYARDIAALARLQLSPLRNDQSRTMNTDQSPVAHILRAVLSTDRSGVIEVERGRGRISYRRGKVLDANFDELRGLNALMRSLALARGEYRVRPRPLALNPAFHFTVKEMVTVALPRLERWELVLGRSVPLDATLAVDFAALARALPSMPDAVNGLVRLFDGQRSVRQVLIDSPLDETVSLEIATRLYLKGVVIAVQSEESALGSSRTSPRLFEPEATEAVERMDGLFANDAMPIQVSVETPARADDWLNEAQMTTGLETNDPSEGWSTTQRVELPPALDQQLSAFNIQPVVEVQPPPVFARDLAEFSAGDALDEQPLEAALTAPLMLVEMAPAVAPVEASTQALESEFFRIEETSAAVTLQTISLSEEVLGLAPVPKGAAETKPAGLAGWLLVVTLLAGATAITAWRFAQNGGHGAVPSIGQASPTQGAALPAVQALEPTLPEPASAVDSSAELVEATRLYDSGRLPEALRALEALVTHDSSSPQAWLMLGLARYDSRNAAGAEEAASTVLALDPMAARAHLLLATIQIDANHRAQANEELEKYLQLEPNGPFSDEAKALLKR